MESSMLGSRLQITTKCKSRYEGFLAGADAEKWSITLSKVRDMDKMQSELPLRIFDALEIENIQVIGQQLQEKQQSKLQFEHQEPPPPASQSAMSPGSRPILGPKAVNQQQCFVYPHRKSPYAQRAVYTTTSTTSSYSTAGMNANALHLLRKNLVKSSRALSSGANNSPYFSEYDFESANMAFDELCGQMKNLGVHTDVDSATMASQAVVEKRCNSSGHASQQQQLQQQQQEEQEQKQQEQQNTYNPQRSFYDNLSTGTNSRGKYNWHTEQHRNYETFGQIAFMINKRKPNAARPFVYKINLQNGGRAPPPISSPAPSAPAQQWRGLAVRDGDEVLKPRGFSGCVGGGSGVNDGSLSKKPAGAKPSAGNRKRQTQKFAKTGSINRHVAEAADAVGSDNCSSTNAVETVGKTQSKVAPYGGANKKPPKPKAFLADDKFSGGNRGSNKKTQ